MPRRLEARIGFCTIAAFVSFGVVGTLTTGKSEPAGAAQSGRYIAPTDEQRGRSLGFSFGFADSSAAYPYEGSPEPEMLADLESAAGAELGRITIRWELVQPQEPVPGEEPSYDWSSVEPLITARAERGIRPLPVLLGAPAWARDPAASCGGTGAICPPAADRVEEFATFAAAAAVAFKDQRPAAIEIWNEPNLSALWGASAGPDPRAYADMFSAARAAIAEVDPRLRVLIGGLGRPMAAKRRRGDLTISRFLNGFYSSVDPIALDRRVALSIHPYPGLLGHGNSRLRMTLDEVSRVLAERDPRRPLWATEVGVSTTDERGADPPSPREQANIITATLRRLASEPAIRAVLLYTTVDRAPDPSDRGQRGYGLVRRGPEFEPKLAYCEIAEARLMPTPPGC